MSVGTRWTRSGNRLYVTDLARRFRGGTEANGRLHDVTVLDGNGLAIAISVDPRMDFNGARMPLDDLEDAGYINPLQAITLERTKFGALVLFEHQTPIRLAERMPTQAIEQRTTVHRFPMGLRLSTPFGGDSAHLNEALMIFGAFLYSRKIVDTPDPFDLGS